MNFRYTFSSIWQMHASTFFLMFSKKGGRSLEQETVCSLIMLIVYLKADQNTAKVFLGYYESWVG